MVASSVVWKYASKIIKNNKEYYKCNVGSCQHEAVFAGTVAIKNHLKGHDGVNLTEEEDNKKEEDSNKNKTKSFINDHEIDPIAASTPTPGPTKAKLNIFDFNEMNIDNISLSFLNQEFKDYENINIDFDIDVLDFWRQHEKKFPLLSQVSKRILCVQGASTASERDFSASGYTVWDRRNALLPRKVNMMMILQQFDKNIERLNKFK